MNADQAVARVTSLLSPNHPTGENELLRLLVEDGFDFTTAEKAINVAQDRNEIRWVAFQGWCRGGRPE